MYLKELRYYFTTPVAYIVIGLYLLLVGLFLWVIPGEWNIPQSGYAQADGLFQLSPWLLLLLCPALTMRLFAEERVAGTWALLLTKPVSLGRIVLEKYLAAWTVVLLAQLPSVIHYFLVYNIAQPIGNIDSGAFFGSYIGLVCLSAVFCSIGLLASAITKSQIVAFVLGCLLCFICFYGFDLLAAAIETTGLSIIRQLGLSEHYSSMSRGVIDLRDTVCFLAYSLIFVLLTLQSLKNIRE